MKGPLVDGLFQEPITPPNATYDSKQTYLGRYDIVLGPIILSQFRVKDDGCHPNKKFEKTIANRNGYSNPGGKADCYRTFSTATEDKETYGNGYYHYCLYLSLLHR